MSPKILVVDDSENIRNVLQINFEWLGYDVVSARDGEEAMAAVEREQPDLLILDVMMPRRNGYQVCRQVKSDPRTANLPVILLTARTHAEDVHWGRDCGADDYITKPFSAPALESVVQRLLARSQGGAEGRPHSAFEAEVERRVRGGTACGVVAFRLEAEAVTVHRQKYGEARHREAMEGLEAALGQAMEEEGIPLVLEREAETLRVMLPCTAERIGALEARLLAQGNAALRDAYDSAERDRGYIATRDFRTAAERRVPLMQLRPEPALLYNQD